MFKGKSGTLGVVRYRGCCVRLLVAAIDRIMKEACSLASQVALLEPVEDLLLFLGQDESELPLHKVAKTHPNPFLLILTEHIKKHQLHPFHNRIEQKILNNLIQRLILLLTMPFQLKELFKLFQLQQQLINRRQLFFILFQRKSILGQLGLFLVYLNLQ